MMVSTVDVDGVLLLLKIAFLVLLYLFIWRIVRTASKDLRLPQESFILAPQQAAAAGLVDAPKPVARLVVLKSPALDADDEFEVNSKAISIGRADQNDIPLEDDEFASSVHARIEPRQDGVWIEDAGSTNGTYLNGVKLTRPRKLVPGDLVRVGETDLRFEV